MADFAEMELAETLTAGTRTGKECRMKLMAYDSPKSDAVHQVGALYLDGYYVGKRHLDGVPIKVTLAPSGEDIEISADWPRGLDTMYWSQQAKEVALRHDLLFSTTPDLQDDDGYIETE